MITLLNQNYGAYYDMKGAGITGPVLLKGFGNGSIIDLSTQQWTYQVTVVKFYSSFLQLR